MLTEKLFGTDGVRGIPGRFPLVPEFVSELSFAAAMLLRDRWSAGADGPAPLVVMGRDTRGSGPGLSGALVAGFSKAGCRTVDLGVIPTPALSYLTPHLRALCGVVVSASHNPAEFNGIKFFTGDGYKMDPACEEEIERGLAAAARAPRVWRKSWSGLKGEDGSRHVMDYLDFLRSTFPPTLDLSGMRLVVDCAHGAAAVLAARLFEGLGAEVMAMGCAPNGRNINKACGALFPQAMQKKVIESRADCGVSFDGDADRALFSDEKGVLLDGDALICFSALRLKRLGLLRSNKVVLTVMSNFGLLKFLKREGISVVSVPVGDRHVTEAIEKEGLSLGGESSGHIIFRRFAATGDGLLTALQTLAALRESGRPLSEHRKSFKAVPQVLKNLAVAAKIPLQDLPRLRRKVAQCERELKGEGRVVIRYSGTEPLLRIMIEGPSQPRIKSMAKDLAQTYAQETGSKGNPR
ncbi:MAG: phosphoglucosamine mutase [Elusimicrobia bacterium]|nr:phosphoglucosamine mutase [Elusimicrobiota bacterium]